MTSWFCFYYLLYPQSLNYCVFNHLVLKEFTLFFWRKCRRIDLCNHIIDVQFSKITEISAFFGKFGDFFFYFQNDTFMQNRV